MKRLIVAGLTGYVIGRQLISWTVRGAMQAVRTIGRTEGDEPLRLSELGTVRIVRGDHKADEAFVRSLATDVERAILRRKAVMN
jgi:hypothetical protein